MSVALVVVLALGLAVYFEDMSGVGGTTITIPSMEDLGIGGLVRRNNYTKYGGTTIPSTMGSEDLGTTA